MFFNFKRNVINFIIIFQPVISFWKQTIIIVSDIIIFSSYFFIEVSWSFMRSWMLARSDFKYKRKNQCELRVALSGSLVNLTYHLGMLRWVELINFDGLLILDIITNSNMDGPITWLERNFEKNLSRE